MSVSAVLVAVFYCGTLHFVQYNVLLVKKPQIADTLYKDDTVFSPRVLAVDRHLHVQRIEFKA